MKKLIASCFFSPYKLTLVIFFYRLQLFMSDKFAVWKARKILPHYFPNKEIIKILMSFSHITQAPKGWV